MATDTLQEYEALLESGFEEEQARAIVRLVSASSAEPEVLIRLDQIVLLLNQIVERLNGSDQPLLDSSQRLAESSRRLDERSRALNQAFKESGLLEQR